MDMRNLANHADMISLSAHKMYGPQGIGALYIRRDLQDRIEPLIYGGGQQNGLRSGTLPLPLCVGMGIASELCAKSDAAAERKRVAHQRDRFVFLLRDGGTQTSSSMVPQPTDGILETPICDSPATRPSGS